MDVFLYLLNGALWFGAGWLGATYNLWLNRRKKPRAIANGPQKPTDTMYAEYTVEELKEHEKFLQRQIREYLHYPYARAAAVEKLRNVHAWIDYREMQDGTYALDKERERRNAELAEFDRQMKAIGKD